MKVSVIIPLFNRKDLIGYSLDSLAAVHHSEISVEVIVVDDGSTDGAYEWVSDRYSWVRLFKNPGKGAPSARNYGMSLASHDFIHFLDSDDLVTEGFYRGRLEKLLEDQRLDAVYGPWLTFKGLQGFETQQIVPAHAAYPLWSKMQSMDHLALLLKGWYLHPSSVVFRKSKIQSISGFDEQLIVNQDVDLLFRFLSAQNTLQGVDTAPSLVRSHGQERVGVISAQDLDKMETMLALRVKFLSILKENELLNKTYKQALGEFSFYRFAEYHPFNAQIALQFYKLSKDLYPDYQIKGGIGVKVLAKLLGNKTATILKKMISKS